MARKFPFFTTLGLPSEACRHLPADSGSSNGPSSHHHRSMRLCVGLVQLWCHTLLAFKGMRLRTVNVRHLMMLEHMRLERQEGGFG
jgi:hypothetical protein